MMSEYSGFFQLTELLWDHTFLSDVTGCRKTQVSDCTGSTVLLMEQNMDVCLFGVTVHLEIVVVLDPLGQLMVKTLSLSVVISYTFEQPKKKISVLCEVCGFMYTLKNVKDIKMQPQSLHVIRVYFLSNKIFTSENKMLMI